MSRTGLVNNAGSEHCKRSPLFLDGQRVRRIEVAASFGGASEVVYVTQSGRRVKLE